jgi:integrase
VKGEIARRNVTNGTKEKLTHAYDRFCRFRGVEWDKPRYTRVEKIPLVPSEKDIDQLIGGMSPRLGTILLFIKETGCRLGEMWQVKWEDLRAEKNLVVINEPEKGSRPRILRISARLVSLIQRLPRNTQYILKKTTKQRSDRILSYFWRARIPRSSKLRARDGKGAVY